MGIFIAEQIVLNKHVENHCGQRVSDIKTPLMVGVTTQHASNNIATIKRK
jgi:hypothetical protein